MVLPWDQRERCRLRARLASGEEVALFLARGTVLRDGDLLSGEGGRVVRVVAAPEPTYLVRCVDAAMLARCAYHLGNRHTQAQVGPGWIRIRVDPVLKEMVLGLGAQVDEELAKFEPEPGAYAGGHGHGACARPGRRPAGAGAGCARRSTGPMPWVSARRRRMNAAGLLHLLQFASPALPIGGYSYSQGLEAALEEGLVHDAASARDWIVRGLHEVMAQWDAPLFWRLLQAFAARDDAAIRDCGATASWPRATPPNCAPRPCRWAIR
jgi:urease accessory protein